ncbi:MAG: hypothetical protein M1824_003102 [Vezdaea acicularis]|nr:MAG: hypothetical protein M1824_003102 [Vezdaea acicularis]
MSASASHSSIRLVVDSDDEDENQEEAEAEGAEEYDSASEGGGGAERDREWKGYPQSQSQAQAQSRPAQLNLSERSIFASSPFPSRASHILSPSRTSGTSRVVADVSPYPSSPPETARGQFAKPDDDREAVYPFTTATRSYPSYPPATATTALRTTYTASTTTTTRFPLLSPTLSPALSPTQSDFKHASFPSPVSSSDDYPAGSGRPLSASPPPPFPTYFPASVPTQSRDLPPTRHGPPPESTTTATFSALFSGARKRRSSSVASSASSETLQGHRHKPLATPSGRSSTYSAFPRSPSTRSKRSATTPPVPPQPPPKDTPEPPLPAPPSSAYISQLDPQRASTTPLPLFSSRLSRQQQQQQPQEQLRESRSSPQVQYPTVRAPTSQRSWATSALHIPRRRPAMSPRNSGASPTSPRVSATPLALNPVTPPHHTPSASADQSQQPLPQQHQQPTRDSQGASHPRLSLTPDFQIQPLSVPHLSQTPSSSLLAEVSSSSPDILHLPSTYSRPRPTTTANTTSQGSPLRPAKRLTRPHIRNWSYRDPALTPSPTSTGGRPTPPPRDGQLARKSSYKSRLDPKMSGNAFAIAAAESSSEPPHDRSGAEPASPRTSRLSRLPGYTRRTADDEDQRIRDRIDGPKRSYYGIGSPAPPPLPTLSPPPALRLPQLSPGAPGSSTEEPLTSELEGEGDDDDEGSPVDDNMPLSIYRPKTRVRKGGAAAADWTPSARLMDELVATAPERGGEGQRTRPLPLRPDRAMDRPSLLLPSHRAEAEAEAPTYPPFHLDEGLNPVRPRSELNWSTPRLQPDRRATVISIWEPPPLDGPADVGPCGRRNVQVLGFCLGFLVPLAWMVAAVWPLPEDPRRRTDREKGGGKRKAERRAPDVEEEGVYSMPTSPDFSRRRSRFEREVRLVDEARFENAKWWRGVNRVMSGVGLLLVVCIVVLVVVAVRMRGEGYS